MCNKNLTHIKITALAYFLCFFMSANAQEPVFSFDFSVENDLIRLKEFQDMRQNVLTQVIDTLTNTIPTQEELERLYALKEAESITPTISTSPTTPIDPMENYKPSLKERRIANYEKWKNMTQEEKDEFFKDVTPLDEQKLEERIDFLKTRLELTPTRGSSSTQK